MTPTQSKNFKSTLIFDKTAPLIRIECDRDWFSDAEALLVVRTTPPDDVVADDDHSELVLPVDLDELDVAGLLVPDVQVPPKVVERYRVRRPNQTRVLARVEEQRLVPTTQTVLP
jgi:hypothetical protein